MRYEDIEGIKIGMMLVKMLQFVDNIAMMADSEEK